MVLSHRGITSRPARIAILGFGGYGKTTLANAVLTHEHIRAHFGDTRYFVTCESTFSSDALLIELGKTLGVLDGAPNALWSRIRTVLSTKESILCLDNFESPWDQSIEIKHSVEDLLSRITALHRLTILITMRGAERPGQTQWSQPFLEPLGTFGPDAAKQVWQAIAGNYDKFSEELTATVDYVPLAVDLLAHLSQMMPPMLLLKEWNSKQTKAIQTGQMHRLSNLDYSIQLSIDSERMKANPSAKSLLGVLSILPDGLDIKQLKHFQDMLTDIDITLCLQTLQQCSLIKLTDERYQLHPIVHHFCKNQGLLLSVHQAILEDFYLALASLPYSTSPQAHAEMVLEVNNIRAVLLDLLESNYENKSKLINASIDFTWFQTKIGNHSDKVISQATQFVQKDHGATTLLIRCLTMWGKVHYEARDFDQALEKLKEAEDLCLSSFDDDNSPLYGDILWWLGNILRLQDTLNDAIPCYQRALEIHKSSHNISGQGYIFGSLGYIYIRLGQLDEAITLQQNALKCHKNDNNHIGQGNAHRCLGEIYIMQNRLVEAETAIQKALSFYKAYNGTLGQGNAHLSLGRIYLRLNQPDKAITECQKALEFHITVNDPWNQGHDYCELGNSYFVQGELDEAESSYMNALELHKVAKSLWGQGNGFYGLGRVYLKRQELQKARGMFEEARVFHSKSQDRLAEKRDQEYLSKLVTGKE
jgi:tetratricopeptide (TPR) repeat protein